MRTVEIWHAPLAQPAAVVRELEALLTAAERERAARLAVAAPWIVARAALRIVLGERLACDPRAVTIGEGTHGKPELPGSPLRFNLSHSGELALIALAEGAEVGVDVERATRRSHAVERTLTAGERAALAGAADRHVALLRVWCRKEALAKARGEGLGWAPETFDTTAPGRFSLADLALAPGYVGALAVEGGPAAILDHRLTLER